MEAIADFDYADDLCSTVFGDKHLMICLNPLEEVLEPQIPVELLVSQVGVCRSDIRVKDLPNQVENLPFLSRSDL